jgi:DNA gyrase subunit A
MIVRIPVYENVGNQIRCMSRNTQGVRLMRLSEEDQVICIGVLREAAEAEVEEQIEDEGEETPPALPEPEDDDGLEEDLEEDEEPEEDLEEDEEPEDELEEDEE